MPIFFHLLLIFPNNIDDINMLFLELYEIRGYNDLIIVLNYAFSFYFYKIYIIINSITCIVS